MKNTYVHAEKVYNNHHKSDISWAQQGGTSSLGFATYLSHFPIPLCS
jgi:hypothetical protein